MRAQKWLLGFAAGIMMAASVWSLLIPAIELAGSLGNLAFLPATLGLLFGVLMLMLLDKCISFFCGKEKTEKLLFMAVTFHNIPEGMVVGAALAGALAADINLTLATVFVLSLGIGIQNIPEGAIISLPLNADGKGRAYAWVMGALSGIVEPVAAVMTFFFFSNMKWILPYMLSLAAGAMIHVVMKELIPEVLDTESENIGYAGFILGFLLMMVLDVTLA